MADLTEVQASLSVKVAGANPSTGVEDSYLEVDSNGYVGVRLYDAAGNAIVTNYGTVDINTLRTASQIGNATGTADFNAGATGAQTLRVVTNQGAPNTTANGWVQKITDGTDTAKVTTNQDLSVSDGLRNGGVYGTLTLTTGGTAYEAKVGGSRLAQRKSLIVIPQDNMFWGYNSSVTTSTGIPISKDQPISWDIDPDSTFQIWLVASASSKTAKIAESP